MLKVKSSRVGMSMPSPATQHRSILAYGLRGDNRRELDHQTGVYVQRAALKHLVEGKLSKTSINAGSVMAKADP
jgi:hypothetical protein